MVKLRSILGLPRRAWQRRTHRWGDYVERAALAVAIAFIVLGFQAIKQARQETIIRACEQSNQRHDDTLAEYDRTKLVRLTHRSVDADTPPKEIERELLKQIAILPPGQRAQLEQGRSFLRLLMDKLSPKTDCHKRAVALTK